MKLFKYLTTHFYQTFPLHTKSFRGENNEYKAINRKKLRDKQLTNENKKKKIY